MPERPRKRPADLNRLAASIVESSTSEEPAAEPPQARAGRQGGTKGGPARAAILPPEKRTEIARKAALARWKKP